MGLNLKYISKYRSAILGLAIIEIVIFHFCADCTTAVEYTGNQLIYKLAKIYVSVLGSVGVEFFVLLSGIGLYYSFSKDFDIKSFYKRRIIKIIPAYAIIGGVLWFIRDIIVLRESIGVFLSDVSLVSFWTHGNTLVWYVAFCLFIYALCPLIYYLLFYQNKQRISSLIGIISTVLLIMIISYVFNIGCIKQLEIALERVPIFVVGLYIGKNVKEEKNIQTKYLIIMMILFVMGFSLSRALTEGFLNRFAIAIYAFVLLVIIANLLDRISSKSKIVIKMLNNVGGYSLEVYLSHVMIRDIFKLAGIHTERLLVYLVIVLLSIFLSIGEVKGYAKVIGKNHE